MKTVKKLLCILLAMTLLFVMAVPALAVDITVNDTGAATGNTYVAFRLLKATVAEGSTSFAYTLTEKYADILKEVAAAGLSTEQAPVVEADLTEAQVIAYISKLDDTGIRTFADEVYKRLDAKDYDYITSTGRFEGVEQGYYLIAETDAQPHPDTVSLVMLDTAGLEDVTIDTKENAPSVEKKVKDVDDSTGETSDWQDSADYDIGDSIPYQITGTVSDKIASYQKYAYTFTDTMHHLTYNGDVKVYLVNGEQKDEITSGFTADWNAKNKVLTVAFADLKRVPGVTIGSELVVEYTATLDSDAVIGSKGNPNMVKLTYSRDPYSEDTQDTPIDTNIVFTFEGVVNKVKNDMKPLEGAGFQLFKYVADAESKDNWVQVGDELKGDAMTTFKFTGLDAGQYKLVESIVPAGYNKADDLLFTIEAVHDSKSDAPALTSLVVKNAKGETISGKDLTFTASLTDGTVSTNVVNNTGTELPSTGGIGTTVFYIAGGVLVLGAGVLLIARKRMSNGEQTK